MCRLQASPLGLIGFRSSGRCDSAAAPHPLKLSRGSLSGFPSNTGEMQRRPRIHLGLLSGHT